ncbi:MAG: gliding motility-associated C-terminal domain-containing protein [Saprospiraceae bacterium]|nr:gliding motility-associated C-terminal domain-containing protein [Saprospiraceae bacterium]
MRILSNLRLFILPLFILFFTSSISAQDDGVDCGSDQHHAWMMAHDPAYKAAMAANEVEYQRFLHSPAMQKLRSTGCSGEALRVPIVFHVMHPGSIASTPNFAPDAGIIACVQGLNDRWQGVVGDGVDFGFEFCLAKRDPNGNPTSGIVRIDASGVPDYVAEGVAFGSGPPGIDASLIKVLSVWPQADYYNVWVVHDIAGSVAGFASFPNGGAGDGTVVEDNYMNANNSVVTHELGHGFNLAHTFAGDNDGMDCPPNADCTVDGDGVCDTPPHKEGDCGMTNPCPGGGIWDNSRRNYMSYCGGTTRFTDGQKDRVLSAAFGSVRGSLFLSEGCIPADLPIETGITRIVYPYNQPLCDDTFAPIIEVKNYGTAAITDLVVETWLDGALYGTTNWAGNIAIDAIGLVTLNPVTVSLGAHDIEYRIVDNNGMGIDTYVDNNTLCTNLFFEPTVTDIPSCWDFESGIIPQSWTTQGPLIRTQTYGAPQCVDKGNTCLMFDAYSFNAGGNGTSTTMMMVPIDLTGLPGAALNFDVAMRQNYYADFTTTLEVMVSTDCGQNFTSVYLRKDTYFGNTEDLHTVPAPASLPSSSWVPTSCNDWRRDNADLSAFVGQEVLVAFKMTIDRNRGENLYLDNICVQSCDGSISINAVNGLEICYPDTILIEGSTGPGYVYTWFEKGKPVPGNKTNEIKAPLSGKYFLAVDVDGCRFTSDTLDVTVHFPPTTQIVGNVSVCAGDTATMSAGAGFAQYLWTTGETSQSIKVTIPGDYYVTVTDANGCTGVDWTTVSSKIVPNAKISGDLDFCEGDSTTISVSPFFTNVMWSNGGTGTKLTTLTAGEYSVTVTGNNGCFDTDTVDVTINPLPVPEIMGTLAICSGQVAVLDAGPGYTQYKWSSGPVNQVLTVNTAGTYSVSVTDTNGCKGSDSVDVVENDKPVPDITGMGTFCADVGSTLDAGSGFDQYLWSTGATTQTIDVNATGSYSVTVTTPEGCSGTDMFSVTAFPSPDPEIMGKLSICEGDQTVLNAGFGFTSYTWTGGSTMQTLTVTTSGEYIVTVTNGLGCAATDTVVVEVFSASDPDIMGTLAICEGEQTELDAGSGYANYVWTGGSTSQTLSVNTSGTYSVTVTTAEGCTGSDAVEVVESQNPVPNILGDDVLCEGESTTLDAGSGFAAYVWSGSQTTPTITVSATGTYTVTVTNSAGCSGTDVFDVVVSPSPVPDITGTLSFCEGNSTILDAGAGFAQYNWSTGSTGQQQSVTSGGSVTVTVTDHNGCTGTDQVLVNVLGLVTPVVQSIPAKACPGDTVQLIASGGTDYLWLDGSTLLSDPTIANPTAVLTTTTAFSVEVSNNCNSEVGNVNVEVNPPVGMAGPDLNVLIGREVTLSATGGIQYIWSGPFDLSCTDCASPMVTPAASGTYQVLIRDINGCLTLDSVYVEVFDDLNEVLDLVNTITPNGDGQNDLLVIKGLESFDANSLVIYNRWGEVVFQQDNYNNTFNGYYKNQRLPAGTYYYVLKLWPGERIVKSVLVILHED